MPLGRRDASRSPRSDDERDRIPRRPERSYDDRHAQRHRARHDGAYDGAYDDMYDDRREDGEVREDRYARRRDLSRSPRRHRSRSHSRTRDAGKPTDTVILEGLPFGVSTAEVGNAPRIIDIANTSPTATRGSFGVFYRSRVSIHRREDLVIKRYVREKCGGCMLIP